VSLKKQRSAYKLVELSTASKHYFIILVVNYKTNQDVALVLIAERKNHVFGGNTAVKNQLLHRANDLMERQACSLYKILSTVDGTPLHNFFS